MTVAESPTAATHSGRHVAGEDADARSLEEGRIVVIPPPHLAFSDEDRRLLLDGVRLARGSKNVAYDPRRDRVGGLHRRRAGDANRIRTVMRTYSVQITAVVGRLLPRYAQSWRVDLTSYRPEEEGGRRLRHRERNDLLHVDAFPARPTNGARILRVFTNINPTAPRRWVTGEPLHELLPRLGVPELDRRSRLAALLDFGLRTLPHPLQPPRLARSPYDRLMLRLHDRLKCDAAFQTHPAKRHWSFAPDTTWVVFTDAVPHAVLSGRHALEQTYVVPHAALLRPELSPLRVLERHCGRPLIGGS